MTIRFCKIRDSYGFCSNFFPSEVLFEGSYYPTSEAAYQAQKFKGTSTDRMERIRQATSPWAAAKLGRDSSIPIREDWDEVRVQVMYEVVRAKFQQNQHIRKKLLDTGHEVIEEHFRDTFWGNGYGNGGENWLGRILMRVREDLRNEWSEASLRQTFVKFHMLPLGKGDVREERVSSRDVGEVQMPEDAVGFYFCDEIVSGYVDSRGDKHLMTSEEIDRSDFYARKFSTKYEYPVSDDEEEEDLRSTLALFYPFESDEIVLIERA